MRTLRRGAYTRCHFITFVIIAIFSAIGFIGRQFSLAGNSGSGSTGIAFDSYPIDNVVTANSTTIDRDERIMDVTQHIVDTTPLAASTSALAPLNNIMSTPLLPTETPTPPLQGTAVVQLMGELGNHLMIFTNYYAVRTIALAEFNLNLTLHVRKQASGKAESAAMNAKCLTSFRDLDFDECNWSLNNGAKGYQCEGRVNNQIEALNDLAMQHNNGTIAELSMSLNMKASTSNGIRLFLQSYVAMLTDPAILQLYSIRDIGWTTNEHYPFLFSTERLHADDTLIDDFYSRGLPAYLAFDNATKMSSGCCSILPEKDEQVFHYRSFIVDLPRIMMTWGGAELKPNRAARMLSASLSPGTKVALVAGRSTRERAKAYETAFFNQSFSVRQIVGQTSIQDFCFLAHAKAGLWGTVQSSYISIASLISADLQNATLYGVNYPARITNVTSKVPTNADLARIIHYPVFDLSDEDVW